MLQLSRASGWGRIPLALALLAGVGFVLRAIAALWIAGPWLAPDEFAYALAGRELWRHGELAVLGGPSQFTSALYPALAGIPLLAGLHGGYAVLRVIQAAALCSTGVVVYAWTRSLTRPRWALAAAALTLALPGGVYAGALVAETIFVPLAALAAWLAVRALDTPTRRNQVLLVVALVACVLTRGEANMLALALLVAAVATRRVRALAPTWIALALAAGTWLGLGGGSPLRSLESYGPVGGYTVTGVIDFVLEHAGDLLFVSGVVPLCAAVLLALARPQERAVRATIAFALALATIAVLEVGIFAAGHAGRLLEREFLFALPPVFVAFGVWLDRGGPRPRLPSIGVSVCAVSALLAMPFGRLAVAAVAPDNPTLVPLTHLSGPQVYGVVALVAFAGAGLLLVLPARALWVLPALLTALLAAASVSASRNFVDRSRAARDAGLASPSDWIDRAATGPVAYLYDGGPEWPDVWMQLLRNDRVTSVIDLPTASVPGPLPQQQLQILDATGELRLVGGAVPATEFIVAPGNFAFAGARVARAAPIDAVLWRLDLPPRIRTWTQGVEADGDLPQGGVATLDVYDCTRGTFHVVATGRDNETLRLSQNGLPVAETELWPEGVWEYTVLTPAAAHTHCAFSLSTTSLVHLDVFAWTPAG